MYTMVKFSKSTTANTVNAGNNIYLTSNSDKKVRNSDEKHPQTGRLFETNNRNLFFTNGTMRIRKRHFSPTDIFETDLRDTKLDQIFAWEFRGIIENLKKIELLNCHIEK